MNKSSSNAPDANSGESENAGDDALSLLLDDAPAATPQTPAKAETHEVSAPAPQLDVPPAIARLDAATAGVLMPSESDEPFRTVYWPLEKAEIKASEIALYLTENADADVETKSVDAFFQNATKTEDGMNEEEKSDAKKFADLVEIIHSELEDPRVYLIGERERTAAIIGKVAGGFGGVVTLVVET